MKKKATSFILTALFIGALGYLGAPAKAQEEQQAATLYVNTLIYFDEEYCAQDWSYGSRELIFYHLFEEDPTLDNIHDKFKDYYNIIFVPLNAWRYPENHFETWASNNSITTKYYLLQDAIKTHGGVWDPTLGGVGEYYMPQRPYWKGSTCYIADLTIFFTGQVAYGGLSPPEWNASILSQVSFVSESNLMHELSHQWWLEHCGGWCCMNDKLQGVVEDWCNNCKNTLNQNREEFGYKHLLHMVEKGARG